MFFFFIRNAQFSTGGTSARSTHNLSPGEIAALRTGSHSALEPSGTRCETFDILVHLEKMVPATKLEEFLLARLRLSL